MQFSKPLVQKIIILLAGIFIILPLGSRVFLPIMNRILGAPDLSILEDYRPIGSIEIYDYKDNFIGVLQGEEDRQVVKLSQISDYAVQAVLAAEDSDFFKHHGFSVQAFFRAFFSNLKAGKIVQGGSTISQQMVKNLFIKEDERYKRSLLRKIRELSIAFEVESKYPKEKILEIYLNQVYFGNLAYGIERAAQRYFSKRASQLNLMEASYLAGLLTAPSYLSKNDEAAFERQKYVLLKMFENGYINQEAYDKALKSKVEFHYSQGNLSDFPYYFSMIDQELNKRFSRDEIKSAGLKVYTGMDPVAQRLAVDALNLGIRNAAAGINQGALVMLDVPTGEVRALVGGVGDFWTHQYNRAANPHTLGSAIKPFVYLTAFKEGVIDPSSIIEDEPLQIPDVSSPTGYWEPQNFDAEFHGPITAKAALVFSRNIPAVKVAMKTGIKNIIDVCRAAGFKSPMEAHLSFALGAQAFSPLEIASAYSTLARGGSQIDPILIRKITDKKGKVLEENKPVVKGGLPEIYVSQVVGIMTDVVQYGTGALANIPGRTIAGKTGTADGSRDTWFIGFTPEYVTAIWCGNEDNRAVFSRSATGGATPAWVWHETMSNYFKAKPRPPKPFQFHEKYRLVAIDPLTGLLANEYTPNPIFKRFAPGTEPKEMAPIPEAGEIKSRGLSKFFSLGKKISKEDKELQNVYKLEKKEAEKAAEKEARESQPETEIEEEPKEELEPEIEEPVRKTIAPQPKAFKIEDPHAAPEEDTPILDGI